MYQMSLMELKLVMVEYRDHPEAGMGLLLKLEAAAAETNIPYCYIQFTFLESYKLFCSLGLTVVTFCFRV